MPPHNLVTINPPRTLAVILREARNARRDLTDAEQSSEAEARDREFEAEQRLEDRRDEFADVFAAVTGLTVEQLRDAVSEAVL